MYSFSFGNSSLLHRVTDDPVSRRAGTMQFPMAMFTVGLRSPPYLIELSRLQQVRILWGRALPKILPSSRFPTHFVPSFLDYSLGLGGCSLVPDDARASDFHRTSRPVLVVDDHSPTREKWGDPCCYRNWI